ncbi:dihydrolipoamide acetyltransferase family protein [Dictyobacter kobayashii]|uniref:Dihydrolipoamide acetyltransferase component of pyruvate dehydrogenase complex n=1 Tax=Dictyobacter kobayashii TaxID=2014872 RepID=A0A402ANC0_9CHLR|nr:dihydrolipoamide acetyltransferase family protein [Dictyobacter kobayashii]GCE20519.1 dihydrolipoamide acetyltransferase component of pyruvate dehydrogenase complex [Dictyobacter kobayashii]
MTVPFHLPDLGEGITEAEIVRWFVKPGDSVTQDQEIVAVQTDKAVVELPSPVAGTVVELAVAEGEIVAVKSVLLTLDEIADKQTPALANSYAGQSQAVPANQGATVTHQAILPAIKTNLSNGIHKETVSARHPQRVLATPVARRMAREFGIDIATISGSGHAGRVRTEDIQKVIAHLNTQTQAPATPELTQAPPAVTNIPVQTGSATKPGTEEEERIPLRGLRRRIAENMVRSVSTIPQVSSLVEVDATGLVALRQSLLPLAESEGIKLSYLPLIIKALVHTLQQYPYINAMIDDNSQEIVLKHCYHIGIATATGDGLLVPVLRHADRLTILEIAREITRLAEAGREQKLKLEELRGSTFTISNYGTVGGFFTTPIINPGEAGILGLGRISKRPWVVEDQIEVRPVLPLSFTADHRLIDGELAMRFLNTLIELLEQPQRLLLHMR